MIQDILNSEILSPMMAGKVFESPASLRDELKPQIIEALMIDSKRVHDIDNFDGLSGLVIHDEFTTLEPEVLIVFKVTQPNDADIQALHKKSNELGTITACLISPYGSCFFEYKRAGGEVVTEKLKELPPLNHIDYQFDRDLTPIKIRDYVVHRKWIFIAAGLFILLMIASALAQASICKSSGIVKGNVEDDGTKVYYLPSTAGYENVVIGDQSGERRFCDERTAIKKGWELKQ
jgi:hypothetical protein